jgi:hypothetical protein
MGDHRNSVRQILRSYQRGLRQFEHEVGDNIVYYEFDHVNSTMDDTYDEGQLPDIFDPSLADTGTPGRVYRYPSTIPAIWVRLQSPTDVQSEQGEYTVNVVSWRASTQTMSRTGLQNPLDPSKHFNDRFSYKGFLYRVDQWQPRGWLFGQYMMVDVMGTEVKTEELTEDNFPFAPIAPSIPWTPGQALDWPNTLPQDWPRTQDDDGSAK